MTAPHRFIAPGALGDQAALTGGTVTANTRRCRGCLKILSFVSVACSAFAVPGPALAQAPEESVTLPSGIEALAWDSIDEAPLYRVRYLAPALADGGVSHGALTEDLTWLCAEDALPRLRADGIDPARIVVSLMAEPVEFGVMTPGVVQVFESYRIEDQRCIWEAF
ncbi:DUF6497 family protein [Maliponia aquimaris]|uniref:Acetolactate synthase n=1 Tax=Maliponia aquimaris TaxID=1673631 RepID=A0A238L3E8_9RHOB|nr:DUF6497 family protein [Maliponia aquimaris]SMX49507.1 hypothetical protein MAA8898_04318 [Maliponia aquimaris]